MWGEKKECVSVNIVNNVFFYLAKYKMKRWFLSSKSKAFVIIIIIII